MRGAATAIPGSPDTAEWDVGLGLWVRPGTSDRDVPADIQEYRRFRFPAGASILDIGSHIGCSVLLWRELGAGLIVAVEPEPDNAELLRRNIFSRKLNGIFVLEAAAVAGDKVSAPLYVNRLKGKDWHSLIPTRGREVKEVATVRFSKLLAKVRPSHLKIDAEGAEYELLREPLPPYVSGLLLEAHLTRKGQREAYAEMTESLSAQGFHLTYLNRYTPKTWHVTLIAERNSA